MQHLYLSLHFKIVVYISCAPDFCEKTERDLFKSAIRFQLKNDTNKMAVASETEPSRGMKVELE